MAGSCRRHSRTFDVSRCCSFRLDLDALDTYRVVRNAWTSLKRFFVELLWKSLDKPCRFSVRCPQHIEFYFDAFSALASISMPSTRTLLFLCFRHTDPYFDVCNTSIFISMSSTHRLLFRCLQHIDFYFDAFNT